MTRLISLRTKDVGGSVQRPLIVDCDGTEPIAYRPVSDRAAAADVAGREVVLAVHGFNVSRPNGARSMVALEAALALDATQRFFGVLWPGDYWLPVVNYPWGASIAANSGRHLADYLNTVFADVASVSIISHSLGGRVLVEAAQFMDRGTRQLVITAGALDADCLDTQYKDLKAKAQRISILSSEKDSVLKLAYPLGDFISDLFLGDKDSPWGGALGLKGAKPPVLAPLSGLPIPKDAGFDHKGFGHGDYFPPGQPPKSPPADPKWRHAAAYMKRAVTGAPSGWS